MNLQFQSIKQTKAFIFGAVGVCLLIIAGGIIPTQAQSHDLREIVAQSPTPITYMTQRNANAIMVQIREGDFFYRGLLRRSSGNTFIGEDRQVRVIYDKNTSRVVVINKVTGTEFYNYIFSMVNEGNL